jgi:DNA-directed RNA polymerase specialized sigma24 family protein
MNNSSRLSTKTDEQLMLAFSHGDASTFDELFVRYHQRIFAFLRRRTNDQARGEELTQETFLALVRSAFRYQPRARRTNPSKWKRLWKSASRSIHEDSLPKNGANPLLLCGIL